MKLELPMFSEAMKTEVIDGRIYVDLEKLVELIFNVSNESTILATEMNEPALGVLALGVAHIGKALDSVLELQKEALGQTPKRYRCGLSKSHPEHSMMVGRKVVRCEGVA
jgi:hypothetical protein